MSRKETELFISEFEQRMKEIRDNPEIDKFKKDLHSFLRNQNINLFFSAKTYFENNRDSGVFKKKGYSDDILNKINSALEYRTLKIEEVAQKNPKKAIIYCLAMIQVIREKIRLLEKNKTSLTEEETEASLSQLNSSIESLNDSLTEGEEAIMKSPESELKELREELEDFLDVLPDTKRILLTLSIKSEQALRTVVSGIDKLIKNAKQLITRIKTNKEFPTKFTDLTVSLIQAVVANDQNNVKKLTNDINILIANTSNKKDLKDEAKKLFNIFIAKNDVPQEQQKVFASIIEKMDVKASKLESPKVQRTFLESAKKARAANKEKREERKERNEERKGNRQEAREKLKELKDAEKAAKRQEKLDKKRGWRQV